MDIRLYLHLFLFTTLVLTGCTTVTVPNHKFKNHAVSVSSSGELLIPTGRQDDGHEFSYSADHLRIQIYARGIAEEIIKRRAQQPKECLQQQAAESPRQRILLFIHGGLNTISESTKRVNKKIHQIKKESPCDYPIFLNWDSGLIGSLADHLFLVRQGIEWPKTGWLASPFELSADAGRSVVRAPLTWGSQLMSDVSGLTFYNSPPEKMVNGIYDALHNSESAFSKNVMKGEVLTPRENSNAYPKYYYETRNINGLIEGITLYVLTFVPQYFISPLVDGFGTPAWDNQLRRASVIFDRPGDFDTRLKPGTTPKEITGPMVHKGALSVFMNTLRDELCKDSLDNYEITLVAHSMGTIIANRIITEYPDLHYSRIIYMAGADSIRNTYEAVFPYMLNNPALKTSFYNLTLHPDREKIEMNMWGIAPRGSLLMWIDNYFTNPPTVLDRTVGVWDNIIPTVNLVPDTLRERFYIKSFDYDGMGCIRRHGDFGDGPYWDENFWNPGTMTDGCKEPRKPSLLLWLFPAL